MYFVNREEIDQTLTYIDQLLGEYTLHQWETPLEKLALERLVHILIESIVDVGTMMIDGFIMRDAGSYEDIIDILVDEDVLPEEEEDSYKAIIGLRKMVVRDYMEIGHEQLKNTLASHHKTLDHFSNHITKYLKNKSKVAHTFSNEELKQ